MKQWQPSELRPMSGMYARMRPKWRRFTEAAVHINATISEKKDVIAYD